MNSVPFKYFLNSGFPTFTLFVSNHRKLSYLLFVLYVSVVLLLFLSGLTASKQTEKIFSSENILPTVFPATAYGSQRHIFGNDSSLVAIYLNENKQIVVSYSNDNGTIWQELSAPLISDTAENVSAAWDKNQDLHLAYESGGNILYRKITGTTSNGQVKADGWIVSDPVKLDISGFAHRPSLILEEASDLPAVSWSSQGERGAARLNMILFMKAANDPTSLANWCNSQAISCGISANIFASGSADNFMMPHPYTVLHPVLEQMPQTQDLFLFWSESTKGKEALKKAVAKKEGDKWLWGKAEVQENLDTETSKHFSLSAVADPVGKNIVVVYNQTGGNTKVVAYKTGVETQDLSPNQKLGSQFSLTALEGKIYLSFRNENGKVVLRQYDNSWSEVLLESTNEGGYPSLASEAVVGKVIIAYTTLAKKVEFLNYNLTAASPSASPSSSPVFSPEVSASPTATLLPTEEPTASPEVSPEPTLTPTPGETASPSATP